MRFYKLSWLPCLALWPELFGWSWTTGLVFGLSLSTASTVVLLRALESKGLLMKRERSDRDWLADCRRSGDGTGAVLLPVLAHSGDADPALNLWQQLGVTLGKVFAFIVLMFVIGRRLIPLVLKHTASTGSN